MLKDFKFLIIFILLVIVTSQLPNLFLLVLLTWLVFYVMQKNTYTQDKAYVLWAIAVSLALRIIFLCIAQFYCFKNNLLDIFGDAADNIIRGLLLSDYLTGKNTRLLISIDFGTYNAHIGTLFNGIFFSFFKKDIFFLKYVNVLFIIISGWLTYNLTAKLYSFRSGRIALTIVLFWATLFIWSITALKENQVIFTILFMLWSLDRLFFSGRKTGKLIFTVCAAVSSLYLLGLRTTLIELVIVFYSLLFAYFIFKKYIWNSKIRFLAASILILSLILSCVIFRQKLFHFVNYAYARSICVSRSFEGFYYNLFKGWDNNYTAVFLLKYTFLSVFHFLCEPFPWNFTSSSFMVIMPQMFIWYLMMFFALAGILNIYKVGKGDRAFPLLIFMALWIFIFAINISNIGTAVRLRDAIMPIMAIFAAIGFESKMLKNQRINA